MMHSILLQLGWRNIWRNKRRTAVILTAIVIGVWSMIFIAALMRGVADRMIENSISTLTDHIQIQNVQFRNDPALENTISSPDSIKKALSSLPSDARWTPRMRITAVVSNARHSAGLMVVGIDPEREAGISFLKEAVKNGRYLEKEDPYAIIVGQALLETFETRIGNKLVLMSQDSEGEIVSRAFKIKGVFRAELESIEKRFGFITLSAMRDMLKSGEAVSEIGILLDDYQKADETAERLRGEISDGSIGVYTWKDLLPMMTAMLKMYDGSMFIWYLVVFIAMGFGLVNTILMAVFERIREFGLFKSIGMKPRWVVAEVLAESFFLLAIGTIAGNLTGILSVLALSGHGIDLTSFAAGMEFAGMPRVIVPVIHIKDVVIADLTVFILGLTVCLYPAIKAARFSPVQAMAYN